jgi:Protein of unknown function (DUF3592)
MSTRRLKTSEIKLQGARVKRGKGTLGLGGWARFAAACILVATLFALWHRNAPEVNWPLVQGTVLDIRIVADHALQAQWGGQITWKAEYRVAYSVTSREHAVWADSGIQGETEADVKLVVPQSRPSCRVQYDPKRPEVSVADCR